MYEIKSYELLTTSECSRVARLDAPSQVYTLNKDGTHQYTPDDLTDYQNCNGLTYYIICNTWLALIEEYAPYSMPRVRTLITTEGLLPIIKKAQDCADYIVHHDMSLDTALFPLEAFTLREITINGRPRSLALFPEYNIGREPMATLLTLLRYPKRFSPSRNDAIQQESLAEFISCERGTKELQRSQSGRYTHDVGVSSYLVSWLRDEISSLYDWDKICDSIEDMDITDIQFSSGAGFDSKASIGSKLLAIRKKHPEYFYRPFGAYVVPMQTPDFDEDRVAAVQAVPKSYKASRIIAMEDTYRLAFCKQVEEFFRKQDRENVLEYPRLNLEDQTINQRLAQEGSESGIYATLDASHASDLISTSLFCDIFPHRYVNLILPYLAERYIVNGKSYRKEMLSTSGHTLTFRHESIVYLAVGMVASRIGRLFRREDTDDAFAWAYGDDTIVRSIDAQLTIECFERIGLKINETKSFMDSTPGYRESCGEEYFKGEVMTSVYYPRFPVLGTVNPISLSSDRLFNDSFRGKIDDSTTMLIDLQKKLFPISVKASRFVWCIVKQAHPKMTSSPYGYTCPDLWDVDDLGLPRIPRRHYLVQMNVFRRLRINGKNTDCDIPLAAEKILISDCVEDDDILRYAARDTYHYAPYVAFQGRENYTDIEVKCYEMYKYMYFLKHGPSYNSPLDRLLGITQPMPSIAHFYGRRRMAWRLQLVDLTK